ncbi:hypothetical protein EVAR_82332_1 [Eumeta japonica]|uniref:Uncharacterized protein n=1 Tax=Eumeta variegata TaxID=151549 RepID=A0A4C1UA28_EUMVA|nr:hypothetical protein EVAR_82332_1 [Eumeta japonica]
MQFADILTKFAPLCRKIGWGGILDQGGIVDLASALGDTLSVSACVEEEADPWVGIDSSLTNGLLVFLSTRVKEESFLEVLTESADLADSESELEPTTVESELVVSLSDNELARLLFPLEEEWDLLELELEVCLVAGVEVELEARLEAGVAVFVTYTAEVFFRLISRDFDLTRPRWTMVLNIGHWTLVISSPQLILIYKVQTYWGLQKIIPTNAIATSRNYGSACSSPHGAKRILVPGNVVAKQKKQDDLYGLRSETFALLRGVLQPVPIGLAPCGAAARGGSRVARAGLTGLTNPFAGPRRCITTTRALPKDCTIDTTSLNGIPDDIGTTDEIDSAIGAVTNHVRTVVEKSGREVLASSDRRKLPADVLELIRAKNAALHRVSVYPSAEHRSTARAFQRRVRAHVEEVRNENWSDLMEEITPSHNAFWKVTKALKTDGYKLELLSKLLSKNMIFPSP